MFNERLDFLIKESKMTNAKLSSELEKRFGYIISKESISKYRNGTRTPDPLFIKNILKILKIENANALFSPDSKPVKKIPIIGTCEHVNIDGYQSKEFVMYDSESWHEKLYCVIAVGDSMSPEIDNGDKIICDPTIQLEDGDIVHYCIDNKSGIKVYVKDESVGIIQLIPYNTSETVTAINIRVDSVEHDILKLSVVVTVIKPHLNNRAARLKRVSR